MSTTEVKPLVFEYLKQLPRNKNLLEFIKAKLTTHKSEDRNEIINELLEMHRTSEGFDPLSLCKGRVHRVKSTVIKKILAQLDAEVGLILQSMEFKEFVSKGESSSGLFELFQNIRSKIQKNDFQELEKSVTELKERISFCSNQDFLITLYKVFNLKQRDRNIDPEIFLRNIKM